MQWIIDIVRLKLASYLQGKIFLWSGAVVDIPVGWALCNGTLGTPDLRDKFIPGAGSTYNPGNSDGSILHSHDFIAIGVWHSIPANADLLAGTGFVNKTPTHLLPGTTYGGLTLPPYYALAYIMKL